MKRFIELNIGDLFVYNGFIFCKATGGFALNMQTDKRFKFTPETLVEVA